MAEGADPEDAGGADEPEIADDTGDRETAERSSDEPADAVEEADVDWEMAPDSEATFPDDPEKRRLLREVAREVRARDDSSEAEQVAAFVHRVSDLYDPAEDTSPAEIYLNMRHIMDIKARGGLRRGE